VILICYDGSADAQAAIAEAGRVLAGHPATVLTVWEPLSEVFARTPAVIGLMAGLGDTADVDEETRKAAELTAGQGAELARQSGFDASPRARPQAGSVSDTILGQADAANATVIVMGTRGRTGIESLLGSVSHAVLQRADRAVMVVPSAGVAAERRERRRDDQRRA
jgi:nucleotide-binding universal stress UspA family protein